VLAGTFETEKDVDEVRLLEVECDWCGQILGGEVRRSQVGKMVLVRAVHRSASGRPCLGTGRRVGTWPLRVEMRATDAGFEARIGDGGPKECADRDALIDVLRQLGIERDDAMRKVAAIEPGAAVVVEAHERRRSARMSGVSSG
jgi:hypothetical protein